VLIFEGKCALDKESSSAGEFHPHALTEPDMKLALHPALTIQPQV
jgi:hypothetical protein